MGQGIVVAEPLAGVAIGLIEMAQALASLVGPAQDGAQVVEPAERLVRIRPLADLGALPHRLGRVGRFGVSAETGQNLVTRRLEAEGVAAVAAEPFGHHRQKGVALDQRGFQIAGHQPGLGHVLAGDQRIGVIGAQALRPVGRHPLSQGQGFGGPSQTHQHHRLLLADQQDVAIGEARRSGLGDGEGAGEGRAGGVKVLEEGNHRLRLGEMEAQHPLIGGRSQATPLCFGQGLGRRQPARLGRQRLRPGVQQPGARRGGGILQPRPLVSGGGQTERTPRLVVLSPLDEGGGQRKVQAGGHLGLPGEAGVDGRAGAQGGGRQRLLGG